MDRGRDDPRGRRLLGSGGDLSGKFDPAEFDALPDPSPSPADRARGEADAAQAHSFFSHLAGDVQRILAGIAGFRELIADIRARLADNAARDAARTEAEEARDQAIAARLVHPDTLAHHAHAGARQGAREAIDSTVNELRRQLAADGAARELLTRQIANERVERQDSELRRRRRDSWWHGALAGLALIIPASYAYGRYGGNATGEATGYAKSRDEVAAASWANTPNGKLARAIDQASQHTIPDIATCPEENGWHSVKQNGRYVCYGTSNTAKTISGWWLP